MSKKSVKTAQMHFRMTEILKEKILAKAESSGESKNETLHKIAETYFEGEMIVIAIDQLEKKFDKKLKTIQDEITQNNIAIHKLLIQMELLLEHLHSNDNCKKLSTEYTTFGAIPTEQKIKQ